MSLQVQSPNHFALNQWNTSNRDLITIIKGTIISRGHHNVQLHSLFHRNKCDENMTQNFMLR